MLIQRNSHKCQNDLQAQRYCPEFLPNISSMQKSKNILIIKTNIIKIDESAFVECVLGNFFCELSSNRSGAYWFVFRDTELHRI